MNLRKQLDPWQQEWRRVSKSRPCLICGKDTWCLVAHDVSATICPRTPEGAIKRCGDAGWLHRHRDRASGRPPRPERITVRLGGPAAPGSEMAGLAARFHAAVDPGRLDQLARGLGLSVEGLRRLGIGWCDPSRAWSFPMVDALGRVLGIRLRTEAGRKFAVRGGQEGLFVPTDLIGEGPLLLAEGPTDTAALLDFGFDAIGRPCCSGGKGALTALVRRLRPAEVVVVADNDGPGRDGALSLVQRLVIHVPRLWVLAPPPGLKDARAWRRAGASREEVLEAIRSAQTHRLSIRAGEVRHGR